jgi:hypothetical protein
VNPLHVSWSRKRAPKKETLKKGDAPYLGIRNEAQETKGEVVRFEVRAVSGLQSGQYKVRFSPGASLRWYFRKLRILNTAIRVAIYDLGQPWKGRVRLRYIPTPQSTILLLPPGVGLSSHLQRAGADAQEVASKMKTNQ